ncbi:MAG: YegS/Rv2252/BmrU family lipid kinase [Ignavibacteria bacterium]|nr:YegS/Rv2252/BmrU family lipid kinase [Ignavibacteria bacterium]
MLSKQVHVVLNPASSAGKTGKKQEAILTQIGRGLDGEFSVCVTKGPLEATLSTRVAIQEGAQLVVAVGGDGTVHEVVNGFFLGGSVINPECELGILCSGTGADVGKSFNLPELLEDQIEAVCGDHARLIDIGKVTYRDVQGFEAERFFVNECQQGMAPIVVERAQKQHKRLGGFLGFGLAAVQTLLVYRDQKMTVTIDDREPITARFLDVVAANGTHAGGGMTFAPRAKVDDGLLDFVLIHRRWIPARLASFPKIYSGKHVDLSWVTYIQGKRLTITSDETVGVEADGELLGFAPCTIQILPRTIRLKSSPVTARN